MGLAAIDVAVAAGLAVVLDKALLTLRDRDPIRTPGEFWTAHGGL